MISLIIIPFEYTIKNKHIELLNFGVDIVLKKHDKPHVKMSLSKAPSDLFLANVVLHNQDHEKACFQMKTGQNKLGARSLLKDCVLTIFVPDFVTSISFRKCADVGGIDRSCVFEHVNVENYMNQEINCSIFGVCSLNSNVSLKKTGAVNLTVGRIVARDCDINVNGTGFLALNGVNVKNSFQIEAEGEGSVNIKIDGPLDNLEYIGKGSIECKISPYNKANEKGSKDAFFELLKGASIVCALPLNILTVVLNNNSGNFKMLSSVRIGTIQRLGEKSGFFVTEPHYDVNVREI